MNYLTNIIANKLLEIEQLKKQFSYKDYMESEQFYRTSISLKNHLLNSPFGIIAEHKRKSPSAGVLIHEISIEEQCSYYEKNGAVALSILTDKDYFGGSTTDIERVRKQTKLPILRKEFILDEIQLFESKACGADAVLLIASILEKEHAHHLSILAKSLDLEVVFEIHTLDDLKKINDEVDCILVNNRNLEKQVCDLSTSQFFSELLPEEYCKISASGIQTKEDIEFIQSLGYSAALIGESILKRKHLESLTQLKSAV